LICCLIRACTVVPVLCSGCGRGTWWHVLHPRVLQALLSTTSEDKLSSQTKCMQSILLLWKDTSGSYRLTRT
jgi:hypothetical protein